MIWIWVWKIDIEVAKTKHFKIVFHKTESRTTNQKLKRNEPTELVRFGVIGNSILGPYVLRSQYIAIYNQQEREQSDFFKANI